VVQVRRLSGEEQFAPYLQLRKLKDHFIFTIESTGAWPPQELFSYAVQLMVSKCDKVLEGLQASSRLPS
jgi:DNA-directed RNA polymerase I and III subunit RPAC1